MSQINQSVIEVIAGDAFYAGVTRSGAQHIIQISEGLVERIEALWADAIRDETFAAGIGVPFSSEPEQMAYNSLVWLFLHEFQHIELNHFDLLGDFQISETPNTPAFGIARRADRQLGPMLKLPADMRAATPQCLELQADHDAADLLLEAYSTEGWEDLRCKITAISGMMMLIERADAKYNEESLTHPKAATRIFQLLGHVTEMPLIRAQVKAKQTGAKAVDPDDIPSADEIQAFGRAVTLPCFFDAVNLARVVEADTIRADLGDPADFFQDIATAKLAASDQLSQLKTSGAREWAKLVSINDRLKPLQAGQYGATR